MNKILNVPEDFVSETLEGILLASNQKLLSMPLFRRDISKCPLEFKSPFL